MVEGFYITKLFDEVEVLRVKCGLSQEALSDLIGVTKKSYIMWSHARWMPASEREHDFKWVIFMMKSALAEKKLPCESLAEREEAIVWMKALENEDGIN